MESQVLELRYAVETLYFLFNGILAFMAIAGVMVLRQGIANTTEDKGVLSRGLMVLFVGIFAYFGFGYDFGFGGNPLEASQLAADVDVKTVLTQLSDEDTVFSGAPAADFFLQLPFVLLVSVSVVFSLSVRVSFGVLLIYTGLLAGFIQPAFSAVTWGGESILGFSLMGLEFVDFAGSVVACLTAGWAALICAIFQGPRATVFNYYGQLQSATVLNESYVSLGVILILLGWLGINGGSNLKISDIESAHVVSRIYLNTLLYATAAVMVAVLVFFTWRKLDVRGFLIALISGLAASSAMPDHDALGLAIFTGAVAAMVGLLIFRLLVKLRIDDPLGVISGFLGGGFTGAVMVPFVSSAATLGAQVSGILINALWVVTVTAFYWFVIYLFQSRPAPEKRSAGPLDTAFY